MDRMNSILIVDDNKENIDVLRGILDKNYKTYIATSGAVALKIFEKNQLDLVLLDISMPEMDGFEVQEIMKKHNLRVPVIFVTGKDDTFSEAKGLIAGAVDYIVKPYNPDIVSIKVRNHIRNKMYSNRLEALVEQRTQELVISREAIILGMSLLAEGRDNETGEHIKRIQKYTSILSNKLCQDHPGVLSKDKMKKIILLSPMHDIGKVSIPDAILLKKGRLTFEEFEIMKNHTIFGAEILKKTEHFLNSESDILHTAVEIAESHHEKFDGSGYPYGLVGTQIPISARIVMLSDIYDALTSIRPYKKSYTHLETMDIILNGDDRTSPSHFDPMVLESFISCSEQFQSVLKT